MTNLSKRDDFSFFLSVPSRSKIKSISFLFFLTFEYKLSQNIQMGPSPSNALNNTTEKTPRKRRKNNIKKEIIEKTVDKIKMIEVCWIKKKPTE